MFEPRLFPMTAVSTRAAAAAAKFINTEAVPAMGISALAFTYVFNFRPRIHQFRSIPFASWWHLRSTTQLSS